MILQELQKFAKNDGIQESGGVPDQPKNPGEQAKLPVFTPQPFTIDDVRALWKEEQALPPEQRQIEYFSSQLAYYYHQGEGNVERRKRPTIIFEQGEGEQIPPLGIIPMTAAKAVKGRDRILFLFAIDGPQTAKNINGIQDEGERLRTTSVFRERLEKQLKQGELITKNAPLLLEGLGENSRGLTKIRQAHAMLYGEDVTQSPVIDHALAICCSPIVELDQQLAAVTLTIQALKEGGTNPATFAALEEKIAEMRVINDKSITFLLEEYGIQLDTDLAIYIHDQLHPEDPIIRISEMPTEKLPELEKQPTQKPQEQAQQKPERRGSLKKAKFLPMDDTGEKKQ